MKDEIKEILLKDFNEILVKEFCTDWKEKRLYIELLVNSTPFSNLLDYITNLQEENKRLKELCDKYEEEHNTTFKLWTTKMEEIPTYEEKKELQDRIDKAIEFAKQNIRIDDEYPDYMEMLYNDYQKLLNILQGKSDE